MKREIYAIAFGLFCLLPSSAIFSDPLQHEAFTKSFVLIKTIDPSERPLYPYLSLDDTFVDLTKQIALTSETDLFWEVMTYAEKSPPLAMANQRVFSLVLIHLIEQNQTEKALLFFQRCPESRKFVVGKPVFFALINRHELNQAKKLISFLPAGFQTQLLMINLVEAYFNDNRFEEALHILIPLPNSPQKQSLLTSILKELLLRDLMTELDLTEYRSFLSTENDLLLDLYQEQKVMAIDHSEEIMTRAFNLKTPEQQEILLSQLVALFVQNKRLEEAVALIARVTHRPLKESLQLRLVKELVAAKNRLEALQAAQEIRLASLNADAYFEIAKEVAKEDRFEEALKIMKQSKAKDAADLKFIELARLFGNSSRFYTAAMALETLPQHVKDQALSAYISQLALTNYEKARDYLSKIGSFKVRQKTEDQIVSLLLESKQFKDAIDLAQSSSLETRPEKLLVIAEAGYVIEGQEASKVALAQVMTLLPQITDPLRHMQLARRLDFGYGKTAQHAERQVLLQQTTKFLKKLSPTQPEWASAYISLAQLSLQSDGFAQGLAIAKTLKDPLAQAEILSDWPANSSLPVSQQAKWQKAIQKLK